MAVYIKPPKGDIGFHKLCDFVKKRLTFLHFLKGKSFEEINVGIHQKALIYNSECLIEGTMKDRISHFILRYLCARHYGMEAFLIQSETDLFRYRLEFYDLPGILKILQQALKQSVQLLNNQHVMKPYCDILHSLIHVATELDFALKNNVNLNVPFTAALHFVRERLYPLQSGLVEVPLNDVKRLLTFMFEEIITQGFHQIKSSCLSQELKDPRMQYMHLEIKKWFHANAVVPSSVILNKQIILEHNLNSESKRFPLCMAYLHYLLRRNHRLPHHSRVQYILFLKEIGVPCQEVITLFMKEYSVPVEKGITANSCLHSWNKSQHRYIYSIEHLYGKRGSRKNYKAHSCSSLQSFKNTSSSDGGCPFACFERKRLHIVLDSCSYEVKDIEDLQSLASEKRYTEACQSYLLKKVIKNQIALENLKSRKCISSLNNDKTSANPNSSPRNFKGTDSKEFSNDINFSENLFFNKCTVLSKPSDVYFMLSNASS